MENDKLWYVVNTYSGHESKVKEKLENNKDLTQFEELEK